MISTKDAFLSHTAFQFTFLVKKTSPSYWVSGSFLTTIMPDRESRLHRPRHTYPLQDDHETFHAHIAFGQIHQPPLWPAVYTSHRQAPQRRTIGSELPGHNVLHTPPSPFVQANRSR